MTAHEKLESRLGDSIDEQLHQNGLTMSPNPFLWRLESIILYDPMWRIDRLNFE